MPQNQGPDTFWVGIFNSASANRPPSHWGCTQQEKTTGSGDRAIISCSAEMGRPEHLQRFGNSGRVVWTSVITWLCDTRDTLGGDTGDSCKLPASLSGCHLPEYLWEPGQNASNRWERGKSSQEGQESNRKGSKTNDKKREKSVYRTEINYEENSSAENKVLRLFLTASSSQEKSLREYKKISI